MDTRRQRRGQLRRLPQLAARRRQACCAAKTALRFGERAWSYRELDLAGARVAGAPAQCGLRPGDRQAALGKNSYPQWCCGWPACAAG